MDNVVYGVFFTMNNGTFALKKKMYCWYIPEKLKGKIQGGMLLRVRSKEKDTAIIMAIRTAQLPEDDNSFPEKRVIHIVKPRENP